MLRKTLNKTESLLNSENNHRRRRNRAINSSSWRFKSLQLNCLCRNSEPELNQTLSVPRTYPDPPNFDIDRTPSVSQVVVPRPVQKSSEGRFIRITNPIARAQASLTPAALSGSITRTVYPNIFTRNKVTGLITIMSGLQVELNTQIRNFPHAQLFNTPMVSETSHPTVPRDDQIVYVPDHNVPTTDDEVVLIDTNRINKFFFVGYEICTAGPGECWRVHYARRKSDGMQCSVWVFEKKLVEFLKPPRRIEYFKKLRESIYRLNRLQCKMYLTVLHYIEESDKSLAFASEAVIGCLHHVLANMRAKPWPQNGEPVLPSPTSLCEGESPTPPTGQNYGRHIPNLLCSESEMISGCIQMIGAVLYLHDFQNAVHKNINPLSVIIVARGVWRLFSLEFLADMKDIEFVTAPPYSMKLSKIIQPTLDFYSPEAQANGRFTKKHDIHSAVFTVFACFNLGNSILQAKNNTILYMRQVQNLETKMAEVSLRIPQPLREITERLNGWNNRESLNIDSLISYFQLSSTRFDTDPSLVIITYIDNCENLSVSVKEHFYRSYFIAVIEEIPEELLWESVWPLIVKDLQDTNIAKNACFGLLALIEFVPYHIFSARIAPTLRMLLENVDLITHLLPLLEFMDIVLLKSDSKVLTNLLPIYYRHMLHVNTDVQITSLIGINKIYNEILSEYALSIEVLPRLMDLLVSTSGLDTQIINLALQFFERAIDITPNFNIHDYIIPTVSAMHFVDSTILIRVIQFYKTLLRDVNYEITGVMVVGKIIPSLIVQCTNVNLTDSDYNLLKSVIYQLMTLVDSRQTGVISCEIRLTNPLVNAETTPQHTFTIPQVRLGSQETSSTETLIGPSENRMPTPAANIDISNVAGPSGVTTSTSNNNNTSNDNNTSDTNTTNIYIEDDDDEWPSTSDGPIPEVYRGVKISDLDGYPIGPARKLRNSSGIRVMPLRKPDNVPIGYIPPVKPTETPPTIDVASTKTSPFSKYKNNIPIPAFTPFVIPSTTAGGSSITSRPNTSTASGESGGSGESTGPAGFLKNTQIGQWLLGTSNNNTSGENNNFLRVTNILPGRRLSDNPIVTPKIQVAPSSASSPGGSPATSSAALPTRRHSSIGPQERRLSSVNSLRPNANQPADQGSGSSLTAPTSTRCTGGSMPNTSSSVPYFKTISMSSVKSRRTSNAASSQGSRSRTPSRGSSLLNRGTNLLNRGSGLMSQGSDLLNQGTELLNQGSGLINQISSGMSQLIRRP